VDYHFAWNHGDAAPEIATTWAGIVGPGVRHLGESDVWTDHADWRPTVLALAGLHDDYVQDGRVVTDLIKPSALPRGLARSGDLATELGHAYKQLDAPYGRFGHDVLLISTPAVESSSNRYYTRTEGALSRLIDRRDDVAGAMRAELNAAANGGHMIDSAAGHRLIRRAEAILDAADDLASS
jgi:hypothetical protein